ncbi:MAG: VCBS repeat-containing protein, partial [Abitibacteriaceae bacterium]|nr:VCBS repeat-containing protein [Abditibacteriaceae bacterium]
MIKLHNFYFGRVLGLCLLVLSQVSLIKSVSAQPPDSASSIVESAISVGAGPRCVAVGDFDGDGKLDFVTANQEANNVSVFLGKGTGSFKEAKGSPVAVEGSPRAIVVADFNGDKKLDLAVANSSSNNVSILLGDGSGGFKATNDSPVEAGPRPISLAVGDLNNDGKLDLAVANMVSGAVSILLGDGSGGFKSAARPFKVGRTPTFLALGDFNGDHKLDVVTVNQVSNNVSVLLGNGDGTFQAKADFEVGSHPRSVAVADVNGDQKPDLIIANGNANSVSVLLNDGNGSFGPKTDFPTGSAPRWLAVGDFDNDGKLDLA